MKRPDNEDLLLAAEWLDENEGAPEEHEPMDRVAKWLRSLVDKEILTKAVATISKEANVSHSEARKALRRVQLRKPAALRP
jgi:hypothetical protein